MSIRFGGLLAVASMTFEVREGEVLSLIGPNGAGKTSAFNAITGYLPPASPATSVYQRPAPQRPQARCGVAARHRAHVPEDQPVRRHDRARQRADRLAQALHATPAGDHARPRLGRRATSELCAEHAREVLAFVGLAARAGRARIGAALWRAAAAGGRHRAGRRAQAAAARRAGVGHEPGGEGELHGDHRPDPRSAASPSCWSSTTCAP